MPDTTSAGARSHVETASAWARTVAITHTVAADCSSAPVTITTLPSLVPSGTEIPVPTNAPRLNGRRVSPAWIADHPSPVCT